MAAHWLETIRESGELAKRMATEVPKVLGNPDLTTEQANQLFNSINKHCLDVERLIDEMEDEDADEAMLDAAESLDDMWATIAEAVAEKLIELRRR